MKNTVGPPVSGENFRNREKRLRKALRYLKNGNSFLILGIRRTGKSSFLQHTAYLLRKESEKDICIELDCQTFNSILDFYKGLYNEMPKSMQTMFKKFLSESKQLPKKLVDFITDIFDSVEILGSKVNFQDKLMNYSKPFEELVAAFFKKKKNVYLFLDELPFFFENIKAKTNKTDEITQILTNIRSWRHAGLPIGITGSLNLHQQLESLGISRKLLAGLNTIELSQFTYEESKSFINELLVNDKYKWWTDEITEKLLELLPDFIPYFLQFSYNEVAVYECKNKKEVEEVFHNEIMPGLFKDFTYQFDERLTVFKGNDLKTAMSLLDFIAINEDVNIIKLQEKFGRKFNYEILIKLIDYEYIKLSGNQEYSFTLKIIRNWWITKRVLNKKK
ncbi:MAG: hypothetical protein K8R54_15190 [Bacteroidales bacterium]|nr:hypothetical protein [Bacteroidales bacterium]